MADDSAHLAELLRLAEWGPRQLVTAVNTRLSSQGRDGLRLDPTAGYSWVRRGFRPRTPIPEVVATVLTERLGYSVSVSELWPGGRESLQPLCSATSGMDAVAGIDDLVRELNGLATAAATPQCPIAEVSGAELTFAVVDQFRDVAVKPLDRSGHDRVLPEQVDLISDHVAALRLLDDRHGGGALSLRYVTAELRGVVDLVQFASYDSVTGQRLLTIVADLAQLLGWLCFDSGRRGAAERYLLLSLGVCRALGADDRAANVIGMLSYVSAFAGHGPQAVRLAEAARTECAKAGPILRARLLGREATAAAADGDLGRFRRLSEEAANLLDRYPACDPPPFLYYLNADQLKAEAGQALVALASHETIGRQRLLSEAVRELSGAIAVMASPKPGRAGGTYPRAALVHATFLVRACIQRGDLEQAVAVMRQGVGLLGQVQSPRARSYLSGLRPELARRWRSPSVRDFLEEFDEASSLM